MEEQVSLKGYIVNIIFRNESDWYTIAGIKASDGRIYKICGSLPDYAEYTPLWITGKPKPGSDLIEVQTVEENSIGTDIAIIEKFIAQYDLSATTTKKLLSDENLFQVLNDGGFKDSVGISDRIIINKILLPKYQREFLNYLNSLDPEKKIRFDLQRVSEYVVSHMWDSKIDLILNVYRVLITNLGLTFQEAEKIASQINMDLKDSNKRIVGLAIYEMERSKKAGHTCQSIQRISERIQNTLFSLDGEEISQTKIQYIIQNTPPFIVEDGRIALNDSYQSETITASNIKRLIQMGNSDFTKSEIEESIAYIEQTQNIQYAPAQKQAFRLLMSHVGILTGGPGTGKTTTIMGLIRCYMKKYPLNEIMLCSPTGRAAQRMSETTGMNASTIHRLLGIGKNKLGSTVLSGDLIIVDEASMLDAEMAAWLFSSIRDESQLILIGDVDQLPSVGPGNVLKDIIQSNCVPVCRLETVYRQSGESPIIVNANRINKGDFNLVQNDSFEVVECGTDKDILNQMLDTVKRSIKNARTVFDVQVLGTSHKGEAGIFAANKHLQELINPKQKGMETIRFGAVEFRVGDKVITTQNNYTDGYFNGDIGLITKISKEGVFIDVLGRTILVTKANLKDISLAYCISIHKSQGSEFEHAIILLPSNPAIMLKRNLLYTGITRSKKKCTVIASKTAGKSSTIAKCAETIDNTIRDTALVPMLLESTEYSNRKQA